MSYAERLQYAAIHHGLAQSHDIPDELRLHVCSEMVQHIHMLLDKSNLRKITDRSIETFTTDLHDITNEIQQLKAGDSQAVHRLSSTSAIINYLEQARIMLYVSTDLLENDEMSYDDRRAAFYRKLLECRDRLGDVLSYF